ncbi:innexin unc-9-like isoform X2 [Convolutriloba macropyga]|uniref:innexin unc-9-like isoform X2 n=1 Tax=Convolutriloba macropyga TaxID=536237 RepID=UPI003F524176
MINEIFKEINKSNFAANGDSIDKLVSFYTVLIYIIGAIFLSISPFVAGPVQCFAPAEWRPGWVGYATRYCYLKNSYYVPFTSEEGVDDITIAQHVGKGDALEIQYYQWIPYYLAFSSILFMIPYIYWTSITKMAGVDLEYLVTQASKFDVSCSKQNRENTIKSLADYIDIYLDNQEQVPGKKSFTEKLTDMFKCCSNQKGNLMGNNYFFSKIMYIIIIALQLFSLCKFLGMNLIFYAFDPKTFGDLMLTHSFDWREKELFPLVTFCNFTKQLEMGNIERRYIQCAMPNNIFNERFFVIVCYWLLALLALMIFSSVSWFNSIFLGIRRDMYVKNLIRVTESFPKDTESSLEKERLRDFVSWYLQEDGIFVFRMIETNTSPVVASEIMCKLWEHFNNNYEEEKKHRRQKSGNKGKGSSPKGSESEEDDEFDGDAMDSYDPRKDMAGTSTA